MPINLKMPALSPTMEEGTLAKWLVKEGDTVASGDLLAEIETDKATMEFEAVDEGVTAKILIPAGTDNVKVGEVIAIIAGEGEEVGDAPAAAAPEAKAEPAPAPAPAPSPAPAAASGDDRIKASPLAKRIAAAKASILRPSRARVRVDGSSRRMSRAPSRDRPPRLRRRPLPRLPPVRRRQHPLPRLPRSPPIFRTKHPSSRTCARRSRAA